MLGIGQLRLYKDGLVFPLACFLAYSLATTVAVVAELSYVLASSIYVLFRVFKSQFYRVYHVVEPPFGWLGLCFYHGGLDYDF